MNVRISWVRAMECMCAQTRPWSIWSERVFHFFLKGMEWEPMLTPRGKSPLPKSSEEGGTRGAASRKMASPTHYLLSCSGPSTWLTTLARATMTVLPTTTRPTAQGTPVVDSSFIPSGLTCPVSTPHQSDSLHKLNTPQQVILFRLRAGHNRLNAHMYSKFKVGESETCPCYTDCRTSTAALPTTWYSEAGHVARTDTTEGQALWQSGGFEDDSHFREGVRHLRLADRLVGLVVRRPPRERKIPGSNPACVGIFSGSSHTSDLKIGTPVATLPRAWRYRVSTGTGRPCVSILWLGEVERLIYNFYLSVAARKIVWADPSLRYTSLLLGR